MTMKFEFLEAGSADCPLIRIYGGDAELHARLKNVFEQLAEGAIDEACLTDLPGAEPVDSCVLIARIGKRDQGVVRRKGNTFEWVLTRSTWDNVSGLIEPFCVAECGGFQWLDQVPASDARVLISAFGC